MAACERARRPKTAKLAVEPELRAVVEEKRDPACRWCGDTSISRFARADVALLPCRSADRTDRTDAAPAAWRLRHALKRLLR